MAMITFEALFFEKADIYINGNIQAFDYAKQKALLLMLLESGSFLRSELARTLWGDKEKSVALQNLRNALASLKKILPAGSLKITRTHIALSECCRILSDLSNLKDDSPEDPLGLSENLFLENPILTHCPSFDAWVEGRQRYYQNQRIMVRGKKEENFTKSNDLQKANRSHPRFNAEEIAEFFMRKEEQDEITSFLFQNNSTSRRVFIEGEEGAGKSTLALKVAEQCTENSWICLDASCQQGDENYPLSLWIQILQQMVLLQPIAESNLPSFKRSYLLRTFPIIDDGRNEDLANRTFLMPDLNPLLLGKIIEEYLKSILSTRTRKRRIILCFRNITWSDPLSFDILKSLADNAPATFNFLLTSSSEDQEKIKNCFEGASPAKQFLKISLRGLSPAQTEELLSRLLPKESLTRPFLQDVYEYTEGNPFFLGEFLKEFNLGLSAPPYKIWRSVQVRMDSLPQHERALLEAASILSGETPFDAISALTGMNAEDVANAFESLKRKGFLAERKISEDEEEYTFSFSHSRYQKYAYEHLSHVRRRMLHQKMADYLSIKHAQNPADGYLCALMAQHYQKAGNPEEELKAKFSELRIHFQLTYELFPTVSDVILMHLRPGAQDAEFVKNCISEAREQLDKAVRKNGRRPLYRELEHTLFTVQGGYSRWNGDYTGAEMYLLNALRIAVQLENVALTAQTLEQLCYLGMQSEKTQTLRKYVFRFFRICKENHMHPQVGMSLRFLGALYIMENNSNAAQTVLSMSIRLFEKLEEVDTGYTLSIVAAVFYQGDMLFWQGKYQQAIEKYMECFRVCDSKGIYRSLGLFLSKAAYCEMRLGNKEEASRLGSQALLLYKELHSNWGGYLLGGALLFNVLAWIEVEKGNREGAAENLRQAEKLMRITQKPTWKAIYLMVKGKIDKTTPQYSQQARDIFRKYGLEQEAQLLEKDSLAQKRKG